MKTKHLNSALFTAFGLMSALFAGISCSTTDGTYTPERTDGVVWGTTYSIVYNPGHHTAPADISAAITSAIASVDSAANAFNPASEIARLNSTGTLEAPSEHFLRLCRTSAEINRLSDGAFDPTLGPLVDIWGFGAGTAKTNPTTAETDSALMAVGMDKVSAADSAVTFMCPAMRLDFGAIAKGYGVDCVATTLEGLGIHDYMVEIGGEVRAGGRSPRGTAWAVQIDAPVPDVTGSHTRLAVVELADAAMATSGNYRNFRREPDGTLAYHTISPVTGRPVVTDVLSATVVCSDAMTADALATASMVLGRERATAMIERLAATDKLTVYGAIFVTSTDGPDSPFAIQSVALDPRHIVIRQERQ